MRQPEAGEPVSGRRRLRRTLSAAAAIALIAAGVLVPLRGLVNLGRGTAPDVTPGADTALTAPVLDFRPAPGWNVATTDPAIADQPGAPQAWAANIPFDLRDDPPGVAQVYPGGDPAHTIDGLPADGIVVMARIPLETRNPLPESRDFPERALPLRLDQTPFSGWEGQSRDDLSMSGVNATVNGWWVSVSAIFGSKEPSAATVREADDEIAGLLVPPAAPTTDAWDQFGIRMDRPDGWFGSLTEWPGGQEPLLEASTVPITDMYDGSSARDRLGPGDLFVVLSENFAAAAHYEPIALPVSVRPQDLCATCEIQDDGTRPPPGHTLLYRSFETAGRQFDLYVEFGTPSASPDQLARVNGVLTTLQIDPVDTRPWDATTGPVPSPTPPPTAPAAAGFRVDVPSGWFRKDGIVPSAVDPAVLVGFGTWDFPTGGGCGPEAALQALPADGAFVWIDEYADPGNSGDFTGWPPFSRIDLETPPARWSCAASYPSRMYLGRSAGRYFEVHVALGSTVTDETIADVEAIVASFRAGPTA